MSRTSLSDRFIPDALNNSLSISEVDDSSPDIDGGLEAQTKWDPTKLSKDQIADYKPFSAIDGVGVRVVVFVSGCAFKCRGCFNTAAQSFQYGFPYTQEFEDMVINDARHSYIEGLTLLGGEPMLNTPTMLKIVKRFKKEYPNKNIWCWTGYTLEWLLKFGHDSQKELLTYIDVLVDGPFTASKKDLTLPFRGSSNQRVLDCQKSLELGEAIKIEKYHLNG